MVENNDALCEMLESIADMDDPQVALRKIMRQFLSCSDGSVRAATARAIYPLAPRMAVELISERIADEPNQYVRAVFRGVISAALTNLERKSR
jgi:hypothetical protein